MVGNEDPDISLFKVRDDGLDVGYLNGIDASNGFVEQDDPGLCGQGSGNLNSSPLPTGQRLTQRVCKMTDAEFFQQCLG